MKEDQERRELMNWMSVESPRADQIMQWKPALSARQNASTAQRLPLWSQLAVAASIGFVIGLTAMAGVPLTLSSQENLNQSATIETVYINLE